MKMRRKGSKVAKENDGREMTTDTDANDGEEK
jgi:hypothetical protein